MNQKGPDIIVSEWLTRLLHEHTRSDVLGSVLSRTSLLADATFTCTQLSAAATVPHADNERCGLHPLDRHHASRDDFTVPIYTASFVTVGGSPSTNNNTAA